MNIAVIAIYVTAILIVIAIALAVVAVLRRNRAADDTRLLFMTQVIATIVAVGAALGAVVIIIAAFQPTVGVTIPVSTYWPAAPSGVEYDGIVAPRMDGGFSSADVTANLTVGTRVLLTIGSVLAWLVPGSVAALVALLCRQLRGTAAFTPILVRGLLITAVVVVVGGTLAVMISDIGSSLASFEVLQWSGASATHDIPGGIENAMPRATFTVTFPFWPIGAGLALFAVSILVRRGTALQKDMEGLV